MKEEKKSEYLCSMPVSPVKVGEHAIVAKDGKLYRTSRVIAIHENSKRHLHFETANTHYHMRRNPFKRAAALFFPMNLAA